MRHGPHKLRTLRKMRANNIIKKLEDHVEGSAEMSPTQIQAAKILLNKVIPDLKAIEQTGTMDVRNTVINAQPEASKDEWVSQFKPLSGDRKPDRKPH